MPTTTADMMVSLDGYTAGLHQTLEHPFGDGPIKEFQSWMFEGANDNQPEIDVIVGAQAYIMGRKMFSPEKVPFAPGWIGWWGEEPPYRAPVFVLSPDEHEPIELIGTTFYFVTGGILEAYERATDVAGAEGRIDIAGGATTVNQYLRAGLIDELRVHLAPVILGAGTRLFEGMTPTVLEQIQGRVSPQVAHVTYKLPRSA